jgi:hypothetical protein
VPLSLLHFQHSFARALFGPSQDVAPDFATLVSQPGFAVYRNTVMKGCIDALQANYPTVTQLVGEQWLRAVAALYVASQPPDDVRLCEYGRSFAQHLEGFEAECDLPYLSGVALLDRFWTEAHGAADAPVLDPDTLDPERLARQVIGIHPAARWRWFDGMPVYSIWQRQRDQAGDVGELLWQGEGALLTRPGAQVLWRGLEQGACLFLDTCAAGGSLAEAAGAAMAVQPDLNLAELFANLLAAGVFVEAPLAGPSLS